MNHRRFVYYQATIRLINLGHYRPHSENLRTGLAVFIRQPLQKGRDLRLTSYGAILVRVLVGFILFDDFI